MALVALVAVPAAGLAKGVEAAEICGANACVDVADRFQAESLDIGGYAAAAPKRPEPFLKLRLTPPRKSGMSTFDMLYLPKSNLMRRSPGGWMTAPPEMRRIVMAIAANRVEPFPKEMLFPPRPKANAASDNPGAPPAWMFAAALAAAGAVAAPALSRARARRPTAT